MKNISFYIKDFAISKEADVSFIPPLTRRKLSSVDKFALSVLNKIYTVDTEEIVFVSEYGEVDRLNTIIEQYQTLDEVSPNQFSGSVHNYPAGFFTLLKKINIPYYALAAGKNTISAGLIKSIISPRKEVLFCFADNLGIACAVSKTKGKFKCSFRKETNINITENEIRDFIDFLEGKTNLFKTSFGIFEREN